MKFLSTWSCNHSVPQKLLSIHRLLKLRALIREAFLCSGWWLTQKPSVWTGKCMAKKMRHLIHTTDSSFKGPGPDVENTAVKVSSEHDRTNSDPHNSCGGLYTNCTKSSMSTSQHGGERAHMLPPLAEDQWKADSC